MTSLDEWHLSINGTFRRRNWERSEEQICLHLAELLGAISRATTGRPTRNLSVPVTVVKSIAWWSALCGKYRIKSVQEMVWAKFPGICPFCLQDNHDSWVCRQRRSVSERPDWSAVAQAGRERHSEMPNSPGDWQRMFARIYPVTDYEDLGYASRRLGEELGELAESVRAREANRGHFYNEAADIFAWLLRVKSVHEYQSNFPKERLGEDLDYHFQATYGLGCPDCGEPLCTCLPVNPETLGRLSLDMPITPELEAKTLTTERELEQLSLTLALRRVSINGNVEVLTLESLVELRNSLLSIQRALAELQDTQRSTASSAQGTMEGLRDSVNMVLDSQQISEQHLTSLIGAAASAPPTTRQLVVDFLNGANSNIAVAIATAILQQA